MSGPLDEFGYPAYSCATDGHALEPVPGDASVLRCPECGLRRRDDRSWCGRSLRSKVADVVVWALIMAIPAALVGGSGWLPYQRGVGTRVQATVLECETSGSFRRYGPDIRQDCVATWTLDGRNVIGGFAGGDGFDDVGRTFDATVRGDIAYSRSLGLPILVVALGLPFLLLPVAAISGRRRRRPLDDPRPRRPELTPETR